MGGWSSRRHENTWKSAMERENKGGKGTEQNNTGCKSKITMNSAKYDCERIMKKENRIKRRDSQEYNRRASNRAAANNPLECSSATTIYTPNYVLRNVSCSNTELLMV